MNRLEQRCKGVVKVLEDYKIPYHKPYNDNRFLTIKYHNKQWHIDISNKYIGISYTKNKYINFLPSFTGLTEFREFIASNRNFMELRD